MLIEQVAVITLLFSHLGQHKCCAVVPVWLVRMLFVMLWKS
jgi:hypothetical protein